MRILSYNKSGEWCEAHAGSGTVGWVGFIILIPVLILVPILLLILVLIPVFILITVVVKISMVIVILITTDNKLSAKVIVNTDEETHKGAIELRDSCEQPGKAQLVRKLIMHA